MNWAALAAMAPYLLGIAVLWAGVVFYLASLEPPVEPREFGAACQCGHTFAEHKSEPHGTGSPCAGAIDWDTHLVGCRCRAFEPCERETEPATPFRSDAQREHEERIAFDRRWDRDSDSPLARTLPAPPSLMLPPGIDFTISHGPDGDRLAVAPLPRLELTCQHATYAVETEDTRGVPLRCLDCGEELAE